MAFKALEVSKAWEVSVVFVATPPNLEAFKVSEAFKDSEASEVLVVSALSKASADSVASNRAREVLAA